MSRVNVVVQTAFIGDLFLSIPFFKRIKVLFPEHKTILVCKKGLKEIFLNWNIVDEVYDVEKGNPKSYDEIATKLNFNEIDHVFCLHQSIRSTLFTRKINANYKIGFENNFLEKIGKKIIFDSLIRYNKKWPDVIRQLSILSTVDSELQSKLNEKDWTFLNKKNSNSQFPHIPDFFKFPVLDIKITEKNTAKHQHIALFPGSVWKTKKWTHEGFAFIANELMRNGYNVSLLGGLDDLEDGLQIERLVPKVNNLIGTMTLYQSAQFIGSEIDLVVCNDSAPAHIASSLQRPVLALFGPTVLDFGFRPWNDNSAVIEVDEMTCRPCGPHGHQKCPLGHHGCMKKISAESVYQKIVEMLTV